MLIPLLSAGNFVIGMGAFVVIGMLGPIAGDFGLSAGQAGMVLTVYALAYAVGSPVAVAITGGWSRRFVLTFGLGLFGVAALLSALAPTPAWLFAARALAALGAGLFTPNAAAVAVAASPPERQATALSNVFFGLTLAQVLGVPAGGAMAYAFGWPTSFLVVAALSVPVLVGLWRLVSPALAFQPTRLADLGAALGDWRTLLSVLFTATFLGAIYVPYTYLAPLLTETMGFGGGGITAALLVFGIGAVAGNLLGGRLSDRIGAARTLFGLALLQIFLMPFLSRSAAGCAGGLRADPGLVARLLELHGAAAGAPRPPRPGPAERGARAERGGDLRRRGGRIGGRRRRDRALRPRRRRGRRRALRAGRARKPLARREGLGDAKQRLNAWAPLMALRARGQRLHCAQPRNAVTSISTFISGRTNRVTTVEFAGRASPKAARSAGPIAGWSAGSVR